MLTESKAFSSFSRSGLRFLNRKAYCDYHLRVGLTSSFTPSLTMLQQASRY